MARGQKIGLDYFPLDVTLFGDRKIKALRARFWPHSLLLYLHVLCEVYRDKGYYLQMDDDFLYTAAVEIGVEYDKVCEILEFLIGRGLFQRDLYESDRVLTSHGIQVRWMEAKKSAAAKTPVQVDARFWILSDDETKSFVKVRYLSDFSEKKGDFSRKNDDFSRKNDIKESKENKRREKERKEEETIFSPRLSPPPVPAVNEEEKAALEVIRKVYEENIGIMPMAVKDRAWYYIKQGIEADVVCEAIKTACIKGKPMWSYADGILRNCAARNIRTLEAYLSDQQKFGRSTSVSPAPATSYDLSEVDRLINGQYG